MKTSFFTNILQLENPLSISQGPPKWYVGPQFKLLAPPWDLVHGGYSHTRYAKEFHERVLDQLDPREVYDSIIAKHGENVTLLCFEKLEKPGEYCHRRMVADWFEKHLNVEVPEWKPLPKMKSTLKF